MKRPAHGAFSGKSDSSGSSFAKLCGGGFRVRSGISSQKIRTFFKKIKSFSNNNRNFLEKITSFFKSVLAFLPLPGILLYFVEICTLFASKKQERPILRQVGIV